MDNIYEKIDQLILAAIDATPSSNGWDKSVKQEALALEEITGIEFFKIIDQRLQALRETGLIEYLQ
jgi:hypothetical protein